MATGSAERNLELGRRINDLTNARDDSLWELFAPDFIQHTGAQEFGLDTARTGDERLFAAIPDARRTIDREVADDTSFVHHWHFDGTVKATGSPIRWEGCSWSRIENGLFVEGLDVLGPEPAAAAANVGGIYVDRGNPRGL